MTRRTQTFTNKPAIAWNHKDQRITQGKPEELICPEICPETLGALAKWEEGFRAAVKTGRQGWTVGNNSGRVRLKIRAKDLRTDSANLPFPWTAEAVGDALLLINRLYPIWMKGEVSLKEAIDEVSGKSDKLATTVAKSWPAIVDSFRESLQEGRNQILDTTYRDNYEPWATRALEGPLERLV